MMITVEEKYKKLRPFMEHGDLILFRGTGLMASLIQNCDKAYWNHIGVVVKVNGALFIVDSNASGVQADRLSWRIRKYKKGGDFGLIKVRASDHIKAFHMESLLQRSDAKWIKYDFMNGGKELFNRKFNTNLKISTDDGRDICSDYVSQYAIGVRAVLEEAFLKLRVAFPQDYDRFLNPEGAVIIK